MELPKYLTSHDWYVARVYEVPEMLNEHFNSLLPAFLYPYGGTLEEVKEYIDSAIPQVRCQLTWVPAEYVMDHMNNANRHSNYSYSKLMGILS